MSKKIFFQSSLPRSGSTLLQNIMGQNPNFYVTPTSGVLELLYGARYNFTNSIEFKSQNQKEMIDGFKGFCREGLLGFYNNITDKPYVLDKSRGWGIHYNFLNSFYGNPKIVCMVRDLTDIFSSMEKKYRENQIIDHKITNHNNLIGTTTEKRVDIWSTTIPIGLSLDRLYQIINEGLDKKILFIKYEDLINDGQKEINKIYNFFDIEELFQHDFNNITQITQEDDSLYGPYGDHKIKKSLLNRNSESDLILGKDLCYKIKQRYKWFYNYFNY